MWRDAWQREKSVSDEIATGVLNSSVPCDRGQPAVLHSAKMSSSILLSRPDSVNPHNRPERQEAMLSHVTGMLSDLAKVLS